MVKVWFIAGMAIFVGIITAVIGFLNEARFIVVFGRMIAAIVVVAGVTYLLTFLLESFYKDQVKKINDPEVKETKKEPINEDNIKEDDLSNTEIKQEDQEPFQPFNPENFTKVSPPTE